MRNFNNLNKKIFLMIMRYLAFALSVIIFAHHGGHSVDFLRRSICFPLFYIHFEIAPLRPTSTPISLCFPRRTNNEGLFFGETMIVFELRRSRSNARLELSLWLCTQNAGCKAGSVDLVHTLERTTLLVLGFSIYFELDIRSLLYSTSSDALISLLFSSRY